MSEFDNLKNDADQYAKDHPQQVREGEQDAEHAAESKLGLGGEQGQGSQQGPGSQQDQGTQQDQGDDGSRGQGTGQPDQNQPDQNQ